MTAPRARRIARWSLLAVVVSLFFALVLGSAYSGEVNVVAIIVAVLIAGLTVAAISWITSMIAGPFVLVKLRNRPDTLGVWTTIVLPLSLAFALVCAIAVPVRGTEGCVERPAVVPLITLPVYLLNDSDRTPIAYIRFEEELDCPGWSVRAVRQGPAPLTSAAGRPLTKEHPLHLPMIPE